MKNSTSILLKPKLLRWAAVLLGAGAGLLLANVSLPSLLPAVQTLTGARAPSKLASAVASRSPRLSRVLESLRSNAKPTLQRRLSILGEIDSWLLEDPVACLNELGRTSASSFLDPATVKSAMERFAEGDPSREIELAKKIESGAWQDLLIRDAFPKLIHANVDSALTEYTSLMPHLRTSLGSELGKALGEHGSPEKFTGLLNDPRTSEALMRSAFPAWGEENAAAAFAFIDSVPIAELEKKGLSRTSLRINIGYRGDPTTVIAEVRDLPTSYGKTSMLSSALGRLLANDPTQADQLTSQYANLIAPGQVYAMAANLAAAKDPALTLQYLGNISGERDRGEAARQAAVSVMLTLNRDEAAVQQWVNSISDPVILASTIASLKFQHFNISAPPALNPPR